VGGEGSAASAPLWGLTSERRFAELAAASSSATGCGTQGKGYGGLCFPAQL